MEAIVILALLAIALVDGRIISVSEKDPGIQSAIDEAVDGDEILVYCGEYSENLRIDKSIVLKGIKNFSSIPVIVPDHGDNAIELLKNEITLSGFRILNDEGKVKTSLRLIQIITQYMTLN